MRKVNLEEKFALFGDYWSPKIVGELNDSYVKLAKFAGAFIWHKHDDEDELLLVIKGKLRISFAGNVIFSSVRASSRLFRAASSICRLRTRKRTSCCWNRRRLSTQAT